MRDTFRHGIEYRSRNSSLAELPSVSAFVTQHEGGHRLVGRTRLHLVIRAVALLAFTALEQVGLGSLHGGKLRVIDGLFLELLA